MANAKPLMNTPKAFVNDTTVEIDGAVTAAMVGEPLIDALNRATEFRGAEKVPQVCYLPAMGTIGSCDTCMVDVNGKLVRSCEALVTGGERVLTQVSSDAVDVAQREAFDRLLENHELYCTVCDNNNGNCTVHNTTGDLAVKHNARPFRDKGYPTCRTRSTGTTRGNAFCADDAWRHARTCR
jgi:formate dehydrogenase major subunit